MDIKMRVRFQIEKKNFLSRRCRHYDSAVVNDLLNLIEIINFFLSLLCE